MTTDSLQSTDFPDALMDACPLAIVCLTNEGMVTRWSRSAERLFGWTKQEVLGHKLPTVPAPAQWEFYELLESNLHGGRNQGIAVTRIRKDGTSITVSLWTAPLHGAGGEIIGKLALLADITEHRRAEQERLELLEREESARLHAKTIDRFRQLLESAPDGIIEVDETGRIVLLNSIAETMFGYSREELMGASVDILLPEGLRGRHQAHRQAYWNHPKTRPMGMNLDLLARRKDGSKFPVEISLSPLKTEDGFRVSAFIRDITERKQIADEIRLLNEHFTAELSAKNHELAVRNREVERANQLKSEFLSSMSHELRTPLHTIIGFADLLGEQIKGTLNKEQKRFVEHIQRDSHHLLQLINEILDLSKIEAGRLELHLESFNSSEAITDMFTSLRPLAVDKGVTLSENLAASLWITADRLRFKEILYNLISNAIKFTPAGGEITVRSAADSSEAFFAVADTGVGISSEQHQTVFEKFSQIGTTARGIREGTGLGLAITKSLVEMHGGRIWVESELRVGSTFSFTLPGEVGGPVYTDA
ncbi:MAG TPA: PAS domain S-box protein [Bryobacteraceae bacterium]